MKLIEALELLKRSAGHGQTRLFRLACGFTPLHLLTFFRAHLQLSLPNDRIDVTAGLYGDLPGNLERSLSERERGVAVVIENADLDSRLGIRQLGGWEPGKLVDIISGTINSLRRLEEPLVRLGESCSVAVSLPTLPVLPIDFPAGWQSGAFELELRQLIGEFGSCISRIPGV